MIKVIGIDPDMRKCGVCALNDGEIELLMSEGTSQLLSVIASCVEGGEVFAIEDVNAVKTIYAKNRRSNVAVQTRIAQNVGMVKAAATILTDYARFHGKDVILVPPGIGKQTKKNAKLFAELTGYKGSTNEDTRDAYWIAKYAYNKLKNGEL
jgi:Holliday junction resolvasome RuvABC endonuclease subunit